MRRMARIVTDYSFISDYICGYLFYLRHLWSI